MIEKLPIKEKDLIQSDTVENSGIEDKLGNQENSEKDFEKIKEEFSRWSKNHIYNVGNNKSRYFGFSTPVEEEAMRILGYDIEKKNYNEIWGSKEYSNLIVVFFENLIDVSKLFSNLNEDIRSGDKKKEFFNNIKSAYFSYSPNISEGLKIDDQLYISSMGMREEFFRNFFQSSVQGELIYTFSNTGDWVIDSVINRIKNESSVSDKITIIEFLINIGSQGKEEYYFKNAYLKSISILEELSKSDCVLEAYISQLGLEHLNGDKNIKDKKENLSEKNSNTFLHKRVSNQYKHLNQSKISSDFIMLSDALGYPKKIIRLSCSKKPDEICEVLDYSDIDKMSEGGVDSENIISLHKPLIMEFIEKNLNISLKNISFQDQIHFMQFLAGENQETFDRLRELFKNEDVDNNKLLKSFLSTSGDLDFGENILSIAENQDSELANQIFAKYAEIVDSVDDIESFLKEEFNQEGEDNSEIIKDITKDLLEKGKNFLKKVSESNKNDSINILETLSQIKTETELFKSAFKKLSECKGKECSLENARSISVEKISSLDILADDELIKKMKKIYRENYPDEEEFSRDFRNGLLETFEKKLSDDDTEFYIIKKNNDVIGFNSFAKKDDAVEFANFNLNKEFKGARIGGALLDETLFKIAKDNVIKAVALRGSSILNHYVNDLGFKIIKDSGEKFIDKAIVRIELDIRKK